ncbi:MAG: DUF3160 domain-containing protein [Anaerolineae bacterium]
MRKHYLLLILPFIFACQLSNFLEPTPASISQPDPTPITDEITITTEGVAADPIPNGSLLGEAVPLPRARYAPFGVAEAAPVQIPAVVPLYTPDLAQISNLDSLNLTAAQREQLEQDGFFERPQLLVRSAADAYGETGPYMLTTDMVLLLTQATQREVLNASAQKFSEKQTYDMVTGLIAEGKKQLAAASDPLTQQAAHQNLAIFNMAGKFYDEAWPIEPEVAQEISIEMTLFQSGGEFESPLLSKRVRYDSIRQDSIPAVRVYTWFLLSSLTIDVEAPPAEQRLKGRQIELLLDIWSAESVPAWQVQHSRHRYQNGTQGPHIEEWLALVEAGATGDDLVQSAAQFDLARFNLFSYQQPLQQQIFEQLVFNNVGIHESSDDAPTSSRQEAFGAIRVMPQLLDVAAVFGSPLAQAQLVTDGEAGYIGWEEQMTALQVDFMGATGWPATLQGDFLRAIQPLAQPVLGGYPPYMQSAGWDPLAQWETGFLISMLSLPFDSTRPIQAGAEQPIFVEPRPELYANLAAQTRILAQGLVDLEMLDKVGAETLLALENDLLVLKTIAEKQLAGARPEPNSAEADVLASMLSRSTGMSPRAAWPVYLGPFGTLTGQFNGFVPTLFVVLEGDQQVVAQGGRLQFVVQQE